MKVTEAIAILETNEPKQQLHAIGQLRILGKKAAMAVPAIEKLLTNEDWQLRLAAVFALVDISGKEALTSIQVCLSDSSVNVRAGTAATISRFGMKHIGYPILREMIASENRQEAKAGKQFAQFAEEDFSVDKLSRAEEMLQRGDAAKGDGSLVEVLRSPIAKELELTVALVGDETQPTELQQNAMQRIKRMPKSLKKVVRKELTRLLIAEGELDEEDSDEPLEVTFLTAFIPRLHSAKHLYFFIGGDSDYDIEHGFVCLFRDGDEFCVCETDLMHQTYGVDAIETFEEILATHNTVKV